MVSQGAGPGLNGMVDWECTLYTVWSCAPTQLGCETFHLLFLITDVKSSSFLLPPLLLLPARTTISPLIFNPFADRCALEDGE